MTGIPVTSSLTAVPSSRHHLYHWRGPEPPTLPPLRSRVHTGLAKYPGRESPSLSQSKVHSTRLYPGRPHLSPRQLYHTTRVVGPVNQTLPLQSDPATCRHTTREIQARCLRVSPTQSFPPWRVPAVTLALAKSCSVHSQTFQSGRTHIYRIDQAFQPLCSQTPCSCHTTEGAGTYGGVNRLTVGKNISLIS